MLIRQFSDLLGIAAAEETHLTSHGPQE